MVRLLLLVALGFGIFGDQLAFAADDPALAPDAPAIDATETKAVSEAIDVWHTAWLATPKLVSMKESEGDADAGVVLEKRIKLLGEKTFSNREWKAYWQQQASTAATVQEALERAGAPVAVSSGFGRWKELADSKVENQDKFFAAIQSERDALEARMEASFEVRTSSEEEVVLNSDQLNPYELRRKRIDQLEHHIELQQNKKANTEAEVAFIEQQLASEAILSEAMVNDLALATTEVEIASSQATSSTGTLQSLWSQVLDRSKTKVTNLRTELGFGEARARSRKVEQALAVSQGEFRVERIDALVTELEEESGLSSLGQAAVDTMRAWIIESAWRILLGLLLVLAGARFALRLMAKGVKLILERADDDPDTVDAGDQRRRTLADVFKSVATIAIYIVASLVALEQIGVNTGPILGSVAILGLAVSFGSQNLVRDVVNGFFILLENQYAVGDVVTIGGSTGTIERITIRSTWIRSANGDLHTIPNGSISLVSNLTRGWSKSTCDIGVAYDADLDLVEKVVGEVGVEMFADPQWSEALEEAPIWIGVTVLGDSAVTVRCQAKVTPGNQWGVQRELNRRLKLAFDAAGIEIPYPQQVVRHINPPG